MICGFRCPFASCYICLKLWLIASGETSTCSVWSCLSFIYILVIADQAWHNIQPPSLLELFLFRCVSIASSTTTKQRRYLTPPNNPLRRATSYKPNLQAAWHDANGHLNQSVAWWKGHRRFSKRWLNHLTWLLAREHLMKTTLSTVPLTFTHSHCPVIFPVICEPDPKYDYVFIWMRRPHKNHFL